MRFAFFFVLIFILHACGNAPTKTANKQENAVSCYKLPVDKIQACKDKYKK